MTALNFSGLAQRFHFSYRFLKSQYANEILGKFVKTKPIVILSEDWPETNDYCFRALDLITQYKKTPYDTFQSPDSEGRLKPPLPIQ